MQWGPPIRAPVTFSGKSIRISFTHHSLQHCRHGHEEKWKVQDRMRKYVVSKLQNLAVTNRELLNLLCKSSKQISLQMPLQQRAGDWSLKHCPVALGKMESFYFFVLQYRPVGLSVLCKHCWMGVLYHLFIETCIYCELLTLQHLLAVLNWSCWCLCWCCLGDLCWW